MTTAAAVLFVQNDCDDIGWWIAYHLAAGFDALVVYDDHSTDGTWDIIQAAASLYPVEAHRVSSEKTGYADRRSDSYVQALETGKDRFDWMICLESDEYVLPETDTAIGPWLERFTDADAITLHWSIFGANHHVQRTRVAPIHAYTRRAPRDFADHRLGKSFIRPEAYRGHPVDLLYWDIDAKRHVTSDGQRFDPHGPVCWQGARILHYVTRNMSHYTRRLSRFPSARTAPDLWGYFNRNDEEDREALRFLDATRARAARIVRVCLDRLYWRLSREIREQSRGFMPGSFFSIPKHASAPVADPLAVFHLEAEDGTVLACDTLIQALTLDKPHSGHPVILVAPETATDPASPVSGFLLLPAGAQAPVHHASVLTRWLPVLIEKQPGSTQLTLRSPLTGNFVGYDDAGQLSPEAGQALCFRAQRIPMTHALKQSLRPWEALRSHGSDFRGFCLGVDLLRAPDADALACAIAHLAPEAQTLLETHFPGSLPVWLTAA